VSFVSACVCCFFKNCELSKATVEASHSDGEDRTVGALEGESELAAELGLKLCLDVGKRRRALQDAAFGLPAQRRLHLVLFRGSGDSGSDGETRGKVVNQRRCVDVSERGWSQRTCIRFKVA